MKVIRTRALVSIVVALAIAACSAGPKAGSSGVEKPSISDPSSSTRNGDPSIGAARSRRRSGSGPSGSTPVTGAGSPEVASIFTAAEDRIGITDSTIKFCLHGPEKYLPLAGLASTDEINVYWHVRNAEGGVWGRSVDVTFEDDENTTDGVKTALAACRQRGSFAIHSATTDVDSLTFARAESERAHSLYYFSVSTASVPRSYSYSPFLSIEDAGRIGAEWILKAHPGMRVGLVTRGGSVYAKGAAPFEHTLNGRGVKLAVQTQTEKDQGTYRSEIDALDGKADVVLLLDDAVASLAMIKQAAQAGYKPQWVLLEEFNFVTDALGSDATGAHPLEALSIWPPYRSGTYNGPYARYGAELQAFDRAFQTDQGRPATSDVAWIFWSWWRVVDAALDRCGLDCTRNRFTAITRWSASPFCPIEFGPNHQNFGGGRISIARAYAPAQGLAAWAEVPSAVCRSHF